MTGLAGAANLYELSKAAAAPLVVCHRRCASTLGFGMRNRDRDSWAVCSTVTDGPAARLTSSARRRRRGADSESYKFRVVILLSESEPGGPWYRASDQAESVTQRTHAAAAHQRPNLEPGERATVPACDR